jgi:prevent-host-death family protein
MARTSKLTVDTRGDVAFVQMSEARKHLSAIIEKVLLDYPHVVIQKRGKNVAVISLPDDTLDDLGRKEY